MPAAVSKRQWRFMMAITHGKAKDHARGVPPKSVAEKYSEPGKNAPEQHGENRGGTWHKGHHKKAKAKAKAEKKKLKKSFEPLYKGKGVGVIVTNPEGQILIGQHDSGMWATPGGHVEPGETYEEAAVRELREEAGIVAHEQRRIGAAYLENNDSEIWHVPYYRGKLKDSAEMSNLKFVDAKDLPLDGMRHCSKQGLLLFLDGKLYKSTLSTMVTKERLIESLAKGMGKYEKDANIPHDVAAKLVGNSAFRLMRKVVEGMTDESFKEHSLDGHHKIFVRKHLGDTYSGRVDDGHKTILTFQNKSLPQMTAELMKLFEWYSPDDEGDIQHMLDNELTDDALDEALDTLVDNYKKHNIGNIYAEMESIREEIRNDNAVDLQQVEHRVMKLFDKLEGFMKQVAGKHNDLARQAGEEINELEAKLLKLQSQIDEMGKPKSPQTIEAVAASPEAGNAAINEHYFYLSRPSIEIGANGKIRITFGHDWSNMDRENLLHDMRAKVLKR